MRQFAIYLLTILIAAVLLPPSGICGPYDAFEHKYAYKPEDVIRADKFVLKQGYWEAYRDGRLAGYVGLSKDWTKNLVGYSGKHMETLAAVDTSGAISGVKLVYHAEPIVLIGLKEESLGAFLKQYAGKNIRDSISVGGSVSMDALTGATVSAVVENTIILETLRKIAARAGMIEVAKGKGRKIGKAYEALSWDELKQCGAVRNISVTAKELGMVGDDVYLDLYVAEMNPPSIGRSLLGDRRYAEVMNNLKKGESAIAVFSRGKGSFKGTGFVRGGVFDRINVEQGTKMHLFHDRDYTVLSELHAKGAPVCREGGVFVLRDEDFDPAMPFKLNLVLPYRASVTRKEFKAYSVEYGVPERFLE